MELVDVDEASKSRLGPVLESSRALGKFGSVTDTLGVGVMVDTVAASLSTSVSFREGWLMLPLDWT